jgi:hypothetical protein
MVTVVSRQPERWTLHPPRRPRDTYGRKAKHKDGAAA